MPNPPKANRPVQNEDGWYIYDGTNVSGPINDSDFDAKYRSRKDLYASKKGFSKWYRIDEVQRVFSTTDDKPMSAEVREFQKFFDRSMQKLESFSSSQSDTKMAVRPTTIRKVEKAKIPATLEQMMVEETIRARKERLDDEISTRKAKTRHRVHQAVKAPAIAKVSRDPKELYLTLKGRLRLGQIVNTFDAGFVDYLFTLSFSSFFWLRRMRQELVFHVWGKYTRGFISDVFVLVPVLNCFKFYALAKLIAKAEEQNHYRKVMPLVAFALGLVPPLAISYLQEMVNRHWILHVVNVRKKQD